MGDGMSAKELGMIHTVDFNFETATTADKGVSNAFLADLSQELSTQLQRNIRQGQYYKLVGIDATISSPENVPLLEGTEGFVKGRFRWFLPTQGRCEAYRTAFKQMMAQMKNQGINVRDNVMYDFRTLPRNITNYDYNTVFSPLKNLASLDGQTVLALTANTMTGTEVFDTHNENINDKNTGTPEFTSGLNTPLSLIQTPQNYVLNEGNIYSGNHMIADTDLEETQFTMAYSVVNGEMNSQPLQWRPDPALYVAIMCGQVEIVLDEIEADGGDPPTSFDAIELDFSFHVAGWKSIMGSPKSKRSRRSRKTHSSPKSSKK